MNRKTYLEKALKEYFEVENLTKQLLEKAASMKADSVNKDSQSHGRKVIQYYSNINGGLMLFEKIWRKNFLKKMRPQYLPALWSVNHNHSRLLELSQKNYCKKS